MIAMWSPISMSSATPNEWLHQRDGSVVLGYVIGGNTLVDVAVEVPAGTFTVVTKWGDSSKVLEGQPLTIIGYPGEGDYDVVEVSVRSIAKDATELRVTSGIDHGNSGSPAISEDGEVMGIARAAGVVVSIENYGSLIPSSLAQAIVNGMIARPDHTPRPVSCETTSVATTAPRTTSSTTEKPGSESLGLWITQLGSSNLFGNTDAVAADLRKIQEVDSSARYLFSQDWPATFDASDRVIFYLGGYPSKQRALDQCTRSTLLCHPTAWFASSSAKSGVRHTKAPRCFDYSQACLLVTVARAAGRT